MNITAEHDSEPRYKVSYYQDGKVSNSSKDHSRMAIFINSELFPYIITFSRFKLIYKLFFDIFEFQDLNSFIIVATIEYSLCVFRCFRVFARETQKGIDPGT